MARLRFSTIALCALIMCSAPARSPHPVAAATQASNAIASRMLFPEVRLRKLHLVRPDLIPYPIYFDVYC